MFVTKIKSVLAVGLVVGLALGGIGLALGLSTNPMAMAQKKAPVKKGSPTSPADTKNDGEPSHEAKPQEDMPKVVSGQLIVHGILDSVDAKKSAVTVKAVVGNDASSVMRLMALVSDKKPAKGGGAADALLKQISLDNCPKLVNVPVRADGDGVIGTGVGVAKAKLKMEDLKAGQVVMLQLAADRTTGFVVVFVRVLGDEKKDEKP